MTINQLCQRAYAAAKKAGWWSKPRSPLEIAALIHTELSEFVEDYRSGRAGMCGKSGAGKSVEGKPIGPLTEMADTVIRVADYCGRMGWDLEAAIQEKMAFNETRGKRHGGKRY